MFVGRINYDKGINLIIQASNHFESKDNIFFILVGINELEDLKLLNLIKSQKYSLFWTSKKCQ